MRLIRRDQSALVALFLVLLVITVTSVASNAYRRASQVSLDQSAVISLRDRSLFCIGIEGLSGLCKQLPPERVTSVLAAQFDRFSEAISELNGTVDHYFGESMMAFWCAPVPSENGTEGACLAALACRRLEAQLYADWPQTEADPPQNLFSVHCGDAIVGTIGSSQSMSYTALGDNVALGLQLRRLNKRYGTRILVSDAARRQVAERFWSSTASPG